MTADEIARAVGVVGFVVLTTCAFLGMRRTKPTPNEDGTNEDGSRT